MTSPSAVEPVRSQKTTVTTLRTSRSGAAVAERRAAAAAEPEPVRVLLAARWAAHGCHRTPLASPAMSGDPWLELAENANTYTPLGPKDERIVTDRYVLWMGPGDEPGWNVAQRFRFEPDELDEVRAEIHAHLRDARPGLVQLGGRDARAGRPIWSSACHALGLVDDAPTSLAIGMVLSEAPAPAPADVEVRRVSTDDEFFEAERIAAIAFGMKEPSAAAALRARPEQQRSTSPPSTASRSPVRRPRSGNAARRSSAARRSRRREAEAPTARLSRRAGTTRSHGARRCSSRRRRPLAPDPGAARVP